MRDLALFAFVFGLLPFTLKRPIIGLLLYVWVSLMNPHRSCYGAAVEFPFAAVIAVVLFFSLMLNKEERSLPIRPPIVVLVAFACWMTVTGFTAFNPNEVWSAWNTVMKTVLMTLVAVYMVNSERDIKALFWVMALSIGYYGLKGGLFTVMSGGVNRVVGPDGTYISDNNTLALALVVSMPLLWYLQLHAPRRWMRPALIAIAVFTVIAAVGSYSRGALIGGAAMLTFLWIKGRQKLLTGSAIAVIGLCVYMIMPPQWFDRMHTIDDYQQDGSAMGRINAWWYAFNVAKDNLFGGGFKAFTPWMFKIYAPDPLDFHVAHSIYFQVLGDHGFVGLGLFLILMFVTWRTGSRVKAFCKDKPDLKWAEDMASLCQVSIVGYATAGAFLSMPYYDLYYYIIAVLVLLEKVTVLRKPVSTDAARLRNHEVSEALPGSGAA